ncbi:hypothetical protein EXU30_14435 [Shewanella maritima]|uniref:Uncharacterized protein n=1 Tax=Shewanella maritima TaxID=2520507 RepID=A0A411PJJ3_9GAMM|nr:hypothetical protein [Shewanella maritima]QBF83757.1 hypothetical protein EXU30_14435 [Shewanella maritima]
MRSYKVTDAKTSRAKFARNVIYFTLWFFVLTPIYVIWPLAATYVGFDYQAPIREVSIIASSTYVLSAILYGSMAFAFAQKVAAWLFYKLGV